MGFIIQENPIAYVNQMLQSNVTTEKFEKDLRLI
jgi:hypothetical protein